MTIFDEECYLENIVDPDEMPHWLCIHLQERETPNRTDSDLMASMSPLFLSLHFFAPNFFHFINFRLLWTFPISKAGRVHFLRNIRVKGLITR